MHGKPYQQLQPHFCPCSVYGHLSKNCPQQTFAQQNVPNYLRSTQPVATPPYLNRPNTHLSVFPQAFLLNMFPKTYTATYDRLYTESTCLEKIADKMTKMAEENRLIKQAVHGTYERRKGNYSRLRNKISSNKNNAKDDNSKQMSQSGKKSVQFKSNANTGTIHSPTVTHSGNATHLIRKSSPNLAASTNSVSTIIDKTESQLDAEAVLDQTHELSPDCKAIMDILYPDIDYRSDSDSDELTYMDE